MMDRLRQFARTRVARRLFFLFVLSAFVPLTIVALLTLSQVRTLLLQQGDQRLGAMAKSYGMTLFERLLLAGDVGVAAAAAATPAPDSMAPRMFRSLALIEQDGALTPLLGSPDLLPPNPEQRRRIEAGKLALAVLGQGSTLRMVLMAPAAPGEARIVAGELRPEFLWGPADEAPAFTEFCVAEDPTRRFLYCSDAAGEGAISALDAVPASARGMIEWTRGDDIMIARSWAQFMRAQFGTPDWTIVASQPRRVLLARLEQFRQLFLPVVLLSILIVTWFTIRQSRHIITPIAELGERVRQIANNQFQARPGPRREDEFGQLAEAFDTMAHRLDRQFASLTALSEIDRQILSTQDLSQVIGTVLGRMSEVVSAESVTVTLVDHDDTRRARTFHLVEGQEAGGAAMTRHTVDGLHTDWLPPDEGGHWVDLPKGAVPPHLEQPHARGLERAYVQPIVWRGEVCGALVLGYHGREEIPEEERQRARELADRVAVAVSSAWRDEQLYVQAHFDALTGSPNRLLFRDRLDIEIARSQREGLRFALLFVDLDHFKTVNDSFGHSLGDAVLREAAQRIAQCIRGSDTVGRQGGDEFTVLLTHLNHPQEAWLIAETVVEALSRPFVVADQQVFLSASVGISSYPQDGTSAESLLKCADTAMYRAKAAGRAQVVFFEERMNAEALARLTLGRDLRNAIERGELMVHYQPQVCLRTGAVRGAEALVRWRHPEKGMVPPSAFIPLAEESGFIDQVGKWILEEACRQMRRWLDAGLTLERVSVNVSPRQFRKRQLVETVQRAARDAGIPPGALEIEITEGLLLEQGEAVEGMLRELADSGHAIALDDFGTGFSSMGYLNRLPVHTIKIDRVFVHGLGAGGESEAIVAAITALSHALGKRVIAEGAETPEEVARLAAIGCDEVQGFVHAPALGAADFEAWARRYASSLAAASQAA